MASAISIRDLLVFDIASQNILWDGVLIGQWSIDKGDMDTTSLSLWNDQVFAELFLVGGERQRVDGEGITDLQTRVADLIAASAGKPFNGLSGLWVQEARRVNGQLGELGIDTINSMGGLFVTYHDVTSTKDLNRAARDASKTLWLLTVEQEHLTSEAASYAKELHDPFAPRTTPDLKSDSEHELFEDLHSIHDKLREITVLSKSLAALLTAHLKGGKELVAPVKAEQAAA